MRVGLLGLGKLGRAMAERMLDENVALSCWNRSALEPASLGRIGACLEPSLESLCERCDILLLVVLDDDAAIDIAQRLCAGALSEKLIVNMGTVCPQTAEKLGAMFAGAGATFLDAPVSGTVTPARSGKLLVLCGGDPRLEPRIQWLFDVLGRRTFWLGAIGAGSTMKFVLNMVLSAYWEVLGEAMALGKAGGLGTDEMLDVLLDSPAALPIVAPKRDHIAGRGGAVSVDLSRAAQELQLIEQTARTFGVPTPAASTAAAEMTSALSKGYGKKDVAEFIQYWLSKDQTSAG